MVGVGASMLVRREGKWYGRWTRSMVEVGGLLYTGWQGFGPFIDTGNAPVISSKGGDVWPRGAICSNDFCKAERMEG